MHLLEQHPDKICWPWLSCNPKAIHLLEENPDEIFWSFLSENTAAIHLLEEHPDQIDWSWLSMNPAAMHLLEQHQDKIDWWNFSENPAIFEPDFQTMKAKQCAVFKEELMQRAFHPSRIANLLDLGIELEMLDDYM